jgi:hypothetical protein
MNLKDYTRIQAKLDKIHRSISDLGNDPAVQNYPLEILLSLLHNRVRKLARLIDGNHKKEVYAKQKPSIPRKTSPYKENVARENL